MDIIQRLLHSKRIRAGVYSFEVAGESRPKDPLAEKIDKYLIANLHRSVTLAELASELGASISTLNRHYKAAAGGSIMQSLLRLRISRVKQLLIEGLTVTEAAEQTGLSVGNRPGGRIGRLGGDF